ncbi:hypothetical protein TIFTF001_027742 [Ficus carica]|uniref:Uncharacterized protein n=1 Tax=Ficus carica TaxID=3494 RepID=A0AA88DPS6_FICCA|nr:hypothetical protein TIFTF001_027742 [Ficus carica]
MCYSVPTLDFSYKHPGIVEQYLFHRKIVEVQLEDEVLRDPLLGCPSIEKSLTLWRCDPIGIRNHNLKVLAFATLYDWVAKIGGKYDLSIDAPNLVSFDYDGADSSNISEKVKKVLPLSVA